MASPYYRITALAAVSAGALCVIIWKAWKWVKCQTPLTIEDGKKENEYHEGICNNLYDFHKLTVIVVDSSDEWEVAYQQLKENLISVKIVGMDCEWVQKNKVALLQLCSASGFCILVRLFRLKSPYPKTLLSFLADKSILKTGVAVVDDGNKLLQDYGLCVCGCVDLRYLCHRMRLKCSSYGLKALATNILNVDISKDPAVRCSNWEAEQYSEEQIRYAATDAAVAVEIFCTIVQDRSRQSRNFSKKFYERGSCNSFIKKPEKEDSLKVLAEESAAGPSSSNCEEASTGTLLGASGLKGRHKLLTVCSSHEELSIQENEDEEDLDKDIENNLGSDEENFSSFDSHIGQEVRDVEGEFWKIACSLCQGLVDANYKFKNKSDSPPKAVKKSGVKKTAVSYSTRQRPLWDNCRLQAPDGSVLCTCDVKKARWYLDKGLADKVSDNPLAVRLHFEPSNRPQDERNYYLQEKENQCVVCGRDKDYVRKFVIPFEYKKFFPSALKDHSSHDVLLLCIDCHRRSCECDSRLRLQLAVECDAPVESGATAKTVLDHDLQKVRSAGRALKMNKNSIPDTRVRELEQTLLDFFGVDVVSDDLIEQAAEVDARHTAEGFVPHGKRVVRYMTSHGGLLAFQARWRQHFLDTMDPQFLPAYWSVDYVPEGWRALHMSS